MTRGRVINDGLFIPKVNYLFKQPSIFLSVWLNIGWKKLNELNELLHFPEGKRFQKHSDETRAYLNKIKCICVYIALEEIVSIFEMSLVLN